ncbi:DDE transposase family protein [Phormidium pseudopriestleyi FRX01]|uniref:DDE transposase family protein n=1 Tax=Phormidium pseudopriestleyi FRX01 TaxID=1759528 RepID=A0ABS3FMN9_9CYAN|nr:DDE transposase family protein [Phormidium pseudopriestleyi]MBO0348298.1 DDE transposase family protein [Phormidium pseudopriestleyi FRX01]
MTEPTNYYIRKSKNGTCEILSGDRLEGPDNPELVEKWGPFESLEEAIARRVGLIRTGKCQPL